MALVVLLAALFWNINVFELPGVDIVGIERSEVGEVAIAFLLVVPALLVDRIVARQRAYEAQFQDERLRVLRVTMRTVQDIVNNNLNQLQLVRLEAEGHLRDETLALFDTIIHDTSAQLTALGNMDAFVEKPMASGLGLDVRPRS